MRQRRGRPEPEAPPLPDAEAHRAPLAEAYVEGVQMMTLRHLMFREEAIALRTLLEPESIARLLCASSWDATLEDRQSVWRAYFVFRFGFEQGTTRDTQVRIMKTWLDDAWPSPWPMSVGFCGAVSALDHLFWFVPFIKLTFRATLTKQMPRSTPPPALPPPVAWQVACRVRAGPLGMSRLARCFVCDVLEVTPPGLPPQHFRQRWARPCADCPRLGHRVCLERLYRAADRGTPGSPASIGCSVCGREFHITRRFPESLTELVAATFQEWRWVRRRLLCLLMFFIWLYTLVDHYAPNASRESWILLIVTACLMQISVSERFHRGIQMIWNTPHRWLYFQVFFLFALLVYLVSLRAFGPELWEGFAERRPLLVGLWKVHSVVHESFLGAVVMSAFSLLYVVTASGVIFLFWKTALRVPTVENVDGVCGKGSHTQCGLCQLGLCLDNTCM